MAKQVETGLKFFEVFLFQPGLNDETLLKMANTGRMALLDLRCFELTHFGIGLNLNDTLTMGKI